MKIRREGTLRNHGPKELFSKTTENLLIRRSVTGELVISAMGVRSPDDHTSLHNYDIEFTRDDICRLIAEFARIGDDRERRQVQPQLSAIKDDLVKLLAYSVI